VLWLECRRVKPRRKLCSITLVKHDIGDIKHWWRILFYRSLLNQVVPRVVVNIWLLICVAYSTNPLVLHSSWPQSCFDTTPDRMQYAWSAFKTLPLWVSRRHHSNSLLLSIRLFLLLTYVSFRIELGWMKQVVHHKIVKLYLHEHSFLWILSACLDLFILPTVFRHIYVQQLLCKNCWLWM